MALRHAACTSLLLLATTALAVQPAETSFVLVPAVDWTDGRPDLSHRQLQGSVHLYRVGESEPEVMLEVGQPGAVPDGQWVWIAEAPGFVSTATGTLNAGGGMKKTIVWPVEPACQVVLSEDRAWRGVSRLDVVSGPRI